MRRARSLTALVLALLASASCASSGRLRQSDLAPVSLKQWVSRDQTFESPSQAWKNLGPPKYESLLPTTTRPPTTVDDQTLEEALASESLVEYSLSWAPARYFERGPGALRAWHHLADSRARFHCNSTGCLTIIHGRDSDSRSVHSLLLLCRVAPLALPAGPAHHCEPIAFRRFGLGWIRVRVGPEPGAGPIFAPYCVSIGPELWESLIEEVGAVALSSGPFSLKTTLLGDLVIGSSERRESLIVPPLWESMRVNLYRTLNGQCDPHKGGRNQDSREFLWAQGDVDVSRREERDDRYWHPAGKDQQCAYRRALDRALRKAAASVCQRMGLSLSSTASQFDCSNRQHEQLSCTH